VLLAVPGPAQASLFGEENGPLTTLVAQGVAGLIQAGDTFQQLKQTYDETKKYVGLVQDAVEGFNEFRAFADSIVNQPANALGSVMPDAAYLVRDLQSPASWARGTGELQRLVRVCLGGGGPCAQFKQAVDARQAREAISATFGTAPLANPALDTVDTEAAYAIHASTAELAKATLAGEQARALLRKCTAGTDARAMQACQSAANLGQVLQLEQTAALNAQLAEANRLQALELAARNSDDKRALLQALERQRMLQEGVRRMAPTPWRFEQSPAPALEVPR
jgi:hypothetical protein